MSESLSDKSITGFLWLLIDKMGASGVNFIVNITLARLLAPKDFGLIAMVLIFFEVSSAFIQSGFGFALIREEKISAIDKSTTFIFNLVTAVILYTILFFCAPAIAAFFDQEILVWIIRIVGLNLIIESFAIIQYAELTHRIDFKTQTKIRFFSVIIAGTCAVTLAFRGFGVWSLVAQLGINALVSTILFWVFGPRDLKLQFSKASFKKLFGFGSNLLLEALIDKIFRRLIDVIIGRFFSATTLGFFSQANYYQNLAANNFQQAIQTGSYPVLAKLKDDIPKLKRGYRKIIIFSSFLIIPVMVLMGILAEPMIVTLIGEKWLPSVPFLQLLCIGAVTYHVNSINLDLLLVLGRADLCLRLEIIKKTIMGLCIVIGIQFGIYGLVLGQVISHYFALFINTYYTDKFLDYPLRYQAKDVLRSVLFSAAMGISVIFVLSLTTSSAIPQLILGGLTGVVVYLGLHYLSKSEEMHILQSFIIPKALNFISKKA